MTSAPSSFHRDAPAARHGARVRLGVEANAPLTGSIEAVLLALLGAEGVSVLSVHRLFRLYVVLGMLLVPPVLLKTGSTTWHFARYYAGAPEYREKGPRRHSCACSVPSSCSSRSCSSAAGSARCSRAAGRGASSCSSIAPASCCGSR
jgi:hypothetical protein